VFGFGGMKVIKFNPILHLIPAYWQAGPTLLLKEKGAGVRWYSINYTTHEKTLSLFSLCHSGHC
jgi:hypothetical protein